MKFENKRRNNNDDEKLLKIGNPKHFFVE